MLQISLSIFLCESKFSKALSKYQEAQLLGSTVRVCLALTRKYQIVIQSSCSIFHSYQQRRKVLPHLCQCSGSWLSQDIGVSRLSNLHCPVSSAIGELASSFQLNNVLAFGAMIVIWVSKFCVHFFHHTVTLRAWFSGVSLLSWVVAQW